MVLSRPRASTLTRRISFSCSAVNTRSRTPALAQRFIRVYTVCHRPKRFGNASVFVHVQDRVQHVQEGTLV
jgi:hypothetical protein